MEINGETCAYKLRAMKKTNLDDQEEVCLSCTREQEIGCGRYIPLSKAQEPFRRGAGAFVAGTSYPFDAEG